MTSEQERHVQLMKFMEEFRTSIEVRINKTNEKLDDKLETMNKDMKKIHDKIEENDEKTEEAMKRIDLKIDNRESKDEKTREAMNRMDLRLQDLEIEMKQSNMRTEERFKLREKNNKDVTDEREEELRLKNKEKISKERQKKVFQRRRIEPEDLQNENVKGNERSKVNETEEAMKGKELNYKSLWAKRMQEELDEAAKKQTNKQKTNVHPRLQERSEDSEVREVEDQEDYEEQEDDTWERIGIKKPIKTKVRKPIRDWFADNNSDNSDSDTSTDSNDDNRDQWSEIKRKKKNEQKKIERKKKKKMKMEEVAGRMRHMIGVGPIPKASIEYFNKDSKDATEARVKAVQEYLKYYLNFDDEELELLKILDSKQAAKDNVIYVALENEEHAREIHIRRAASGNEDLIVRDYIPPSFHSRYMAIARKAAQKRSVDKTLKTQLRWGLKDVEVFVKTRGENEQFRRISLKDFMEDDELPEYDSTLRWNQRRDQRLKNRPIFGEACPVLPSLASKVVGSGRPKTLSRKLSTGSKVSQQRGQEVTH